MRVKCVPFGRKPCEAAVLQRLTEMGLAGAIQTYMHFSNVGFAKIKSICPRQTDSCGGHAERGRGKCKNILF